MERTLKLLCILTLYKSNGYSPMKLRHFAKEGHNVFPSPMQGIWLGPVLFPVMVSGWGPRAKFVDALTATEIVPRNSPPILGHIVTIYTPEFTIRSKMQVSNNAD